MQPRLRLAVRAVLRWPGLAGAADPVRLAALVMMAKAAAETGEVEITARELGRWIGLSQSQVSSSVIPALRERGVAQIETRPGEFGQDAGLRCRLVPMGEAQGVVGHPLALRTTELATMLRFVEGLFAPGWGGATQPGLLAARTGRGAATDRLALLLLALETTERGRLRLCGGAADKQRGRPAVTLARMLGCKPAGAEGVLGRLVDVGVVVLARKQTRSGLHGQSRLVIPAVAAAHRAGNAGASTSEMSAARSNSFVADPGDTAMPVQGTPAGDKTQVSGSDAGEMPGVGEPGDTAPLHTDHPPVASEVGESEGACGFSGYGREGSGDLPRRAGAREGQDGDQARRLTLVGGPDGSLREEQHKHPAPQQHTDPEQTADPASAEGGQDAAAQLLADMGGRHDSGLRGRVPRPRRELQVALAPVEALWDRLPRESTRRLVEKTTRRELRRVATWLGEDRAQKYLAKRLTRRLTGQPGRAFGVKDPVAWMLERGLPRRSDCGDMRCDEGVLMHSGAECALCEDVVLDLRGRRRRVAVEVQDELPADATPAMQREAFEGRLRKAVAEDAARAEQRRLARAEAQAEAAASAAEDRARQEAEQARHGAMPCVQCGEPESAGLCPVCREHRETEKLIEEAVALVAGGCGDPDDPALTAALAVSAETEARTRVQDACVRLDASGGTDVSIALEGRGMAELIVREYRATALRTLGCSLQAEAEAEARSAHAAQMRRRHLHPSVEAAEQAAAEAAEEARRRTAEHLLAQRSTAWLTTHTQLPAMAPELQERSAAYAAGAAQARAAATAHPAQDNHADRRVARPGRRRLLRPEPDSLQAAADADATARLRAQIAAEMPGLAAITAAHHGTIYDTLPHPGRPSADRRVANRGCHDEGRA
ncbi:hypothetical protein AB0O20_34910 [Streptomyces kronopolitis]|uniref:hypothetical protein n=1 Tax=Streptomyces kronopolitis TaxID=1612435 RepID=UPI00342E6915